MTRLLTATLLSLLTLSSCINLIEGEGESISEKRALSEFDEIVLNCSADVNIRHNLIKDNSNAEVVAQENLLPYIKTTVEGGVLTIDIEGNVMSTSKMEVNVNCNGVEKLVSDGSGDMRSTNTLRFEDLTIKHDGSGDVELNLKGGDVKINHDGSGDMTLEGNVDELDLSSDGSGDFNGFNLISKEADVENDGSGDVNIHVKEVLDVTNDGSGDVNYRGNPKEMKQKNNGSGSIKNEN